MVSLSTAIYFSSAQRTRVSAIPRSFNATDTAKRLIETAVQPENLINRGHHCAVYQIPAYPRYLLRVPTDIATKFVRRRFREWQPFSPETQLFNGLNIGETVASSGRIQLVKRIEGVFAGIPYGLAPKSPTNKMDVIWTKKFRDYAWQTYCAHMQRTAAMPQGRFDKLAKLIKEVDRVSKGELVVDAGSNNWIVGSKAFGIVDLATKQQAFETYPCHANHLAGMVGALMDNGYGCVLQDNPDWFKGRAALPVDGLNQLQQFRKTILKKSFIAAHRNKLDTTLNPYAWGVFKDTYGLQKSFELAGLAPANLAEIIPAFQNDERNFLKVLHRHI